MTVPSIVRGTYVSILVEDPDNAGAFLPLCGITTRTLTEQVNTNDAFTRNCDDPEDIPFRRLIQTGKQWDLSGSGQYNRAQAALIGSLVGVRANYRFLIGEPADDAVYTSYFGGPAMLTQRQITGADDDFVQTELTIGSDGEWVETEV
ncbi:phage tail protein [Caulobacter hibisci]|uniref:Phage tail protein n=1 Tax=Caulobacter hibisci TaxID=2035993 RepID=A0ABS0SS50_9CAUL|nr:hypothetical protein [Caulobacter hibisci]MBI1682388.1 hypothetical protein [Caulobacter hibisci]